MANRRLTPSERREVRALCRLGRLGRLSAHQNIRCGELYNVNMTDYAEAAARGRADADAEVNPKGKALDG